MTTKEQLERVERLSRLRAQVGNTIVDQLLQAHRFDGQQPTPPSLLRAMEDVESWTPSLAAPVPFKQHDIDRVAPAQFFSDNCPAALTGLADPIRAESGAAAGSDAACNALLDLAARAYPALLTQTERNLSLSDETWAPLRLRSGWADVPPPAEYLAAVEALRADPGLGGLFEAGTKGLETTFGGNKYALRMYDPTELLLYGAWRLALLRGAWDAPSFRTTIVEQLDRVRAAAEGQPVDVPIFCGFSRAKVDGACGLYRAGAKGWVSSGWLLLSVRHRGIARSKRRSVRRAADSRKGDTRCGRPTRNSGARRGLRCAALRANRRWLHRATVAGLVKFDDLDARMRVFETAHDLCVLPDIYMVARLDGRSFTKLTKEVHAFEAPFDPRFRDMMVETTRHLMGEVGMRIVYGYTLSDEIPCCCTATTRASGES